MFRRSFVKCVPQSRLRIPYVQRQYWANDSQSTNPILEKPKRKRGRKLLFSVLASAAFGGFVIYETKDNGTIGPITV